MNMLTRRELLASTAVAGGLALIGSKQQARAAASDLKLLGKVKPQSALAIEKSPLSVGFETLDRQMFDPARTYEHLARLGAKHARCQTGWARTETQRGKYDFGWLDDVVDNLRKIGVQPWFNLGYGNPLYTPEATDHGAVGWAPVFSEDARAGWLRFVAAAAEHYRDRVNQWEIWNEPNITNFWKPSKPDAKAYVELVRITAPVIRKRVPNAMIIGGAYAGIPMPYIEECLEAGMAELVDRVSYHPYRPMPETGTRGFASYAAEIARLRELVAQYRQGAELWQGENGCPSQGGPGSAGALSQLDWNEQRQAKWLVRRIITDMSLGLELTSYYHTVDMVGRAGMAMYAGKINYKGLLRANEYTPKPAYFAYQCLAALFDARTQRAPEARMETASEPPEAFQSAVFERWQEWSHAAGKPGRAIVAWWAAADLQKPFEPQRVDLKLTSPAGCAPESPVLVDPLSQEVRTLPQPERTGEAVVFRGMPLRDYPLFVTDRAVALK
ncbi:MAG: GH39 family glycosyl hydrolase [Planctomycetota bacterium]